MTTDATAHDAEMIRAVDTLVTRLEREHAWAEELRDDLLKTQSEIARLLGAADAAIHALPLPHRRPFRLRAGRIALGPDKPGRPAKDARYQAVLDYVARRPDQEVRNGSIRQMLRRHGLDDDARYLSNVLSRWCTEGMLSRLGHGKYRVNGADKRLRGLRLKPDSDGHRATIRAEIAEGRAAAEARFDEAREETPRTEMAEEDLAHDIRAEEAQAERTAPIALTDPDAAKPLTPEDMEDIRARLEEKSQEWDAERKHAEELAKAPRIRPLS